MHRREIWMKCYSVSLGKITGKCICNKSIIVMVIIFLKVVWEWDNKKKSHSRKWKIFCHKQFHVLIRPDCKNGSIFFRAERKITQSCKYSLLKSKHLIKNPNHLWPGFILSNYMIDLITQHHFPDILHRRWAKAHERFVEIFERKFITHFLFVRIAQIPDFLESDEVCRKLGRG